MQNNIISERNYLFDNLKALLILLVVFTHCIRTYMCDSHILKSFYCFIYIFHMPLFIFISGYFSKNVEKCKRNAFNNIFIPYVLFDIIWYGINSIIDGKLEFSVLKPGYALWYLLSLFYWKISLKYLIKIKYILPISMLVAIFMGVIGVSYLSFSRTFAFLPFFLLGYYCNKNTIDYIKKINSRYCYLTLFIILFIVIYIVFHFNISVSFLYNSKSYFDFHFNIVTGILLKILVFFIAIILGISIINIIPDNKTIYSYIGKRTLTVYLFHTYLVNVLHKYIPIWNKSILLNIIILSSGIIMTIVLSSDIIQKLYYNTFGKIKYKIGVIYSTKNPKYYKNLFLNDYTNL